MKEILMKYGGYFIGILFSPIIWKIIDILERTFESRKHKKDGPKDSNSRKGF